MLYPLRLELAETRSAQKLDDAFLVLDQIGKGTVASIAAEIETIQRSCAISRPPGHRG